MPIAKHSSVCVRVCVRKFTCRVKLMWRGDCRFITFGFLVRGVVFTENATASEKRELCKNKETSEKCKQKLTLWALEEHHHSAIEEQYLICEQLLGLQHWQLSFFYRKHNIQFKCRGVLPITAMLMGISTSTKQRNLIVHSMAIPSTTRWHLMNMITAFDRWSGLAVLLSGSVRAGGASEWALVRGMS